MTKIKTSELTGAALDWAVAMCEGRTDVRVDPDDGELVGQSEFDYSTDWAQAGPIIEREKIDLFTEKQTYPESWCASVARHQNGRRLVGWRLHEYGETALIAAMRCYVTSKLGTEIEIPEVFA